MRHDLGAPKQNSINLLVLSNMKIFVILYNNLFYFSSILFSWYNKALSSTIALKTKKLFIQPAHSARYKLYYI